MVEKKKTEKLRNTKIRVKGYERVGKKIKGYPKWIDKYPRKYRTFRRIGGIVRFVEVTRTGKKYRIKILDGKVGQPIRAGILEINQSGKTKHYLPNKKFMQKELHKPEIEAFMKLAESTDEKSFALDFERYLNNPERIAITKGGRSSTMKLADFELSGHSHPFVQKSQKTPSVGDIRNMKLLYPEFIITYDEYGVEKTNEIYFLLIEDVEKYDAWTVRKSPRDKHDSPISDVELSSEKAKLKAFEKNAKKKQRIDSITMDTLFDSEEGRYIFYNVTGVKIYPYDPTIYGVRFELPDDAKPGHAIIPNPGTENLKEWTWRSKPYINMEKTKEAIAQQRNDFTSTILRFQEKPTLEDQLNASQWMLSYLRDQQKEGIMNQDAVQKEIEKEVVYYQELVRKIEQEQKEREKAFGTATTPQQIEEAWNQKQQTSSLPLSSTDQTSRWLSLSGEQLKKELNDISKYPNVESLKEASESLLSNQEKKLKTRKRLVEIIEKKIAEDRAISHLGR